jgi:hypothetical protein
LQHNGTQQLQQASSRFSNNTSSRRHVPTASGSSPGPSSSSSNAGRAPIDIVLRGLAGGGIGAGIGGMVRLQESSCGTLLTPCSLVGCPPAAMHYASPLGSLREAGKLFCWQAIFSMRQWPFARFLGMLPMRHVVMVVLLGADHCQWCIHIAHPHLGQLLPSSAASLTSSVTVLLPKIWFMKC